MRQDARIRPRLPIRRAATLTLIDGARLDGWTIDLSHGGVSLWLAGRVRLAQYCAVRFEAGARPVQAIGQVRYSEPAEDAGFRIGIQFIQVDADSAQAIAALLG